MTLKRLIALSIVTTAALGFAGGLVVAKRLSASAPVPGVVEQAPAPMPSASRPAAVLPPAGTLPDLSPVAEAALKVSANISSTSVVQRRNPWPLWFDDGPQFQESQSLGSGVIVSPDGLILTNTHVIGGAGSRVTDITVTLADGRGRPGKIVGIDDLSDLAVVKIDAPTPLPTLPWGDSSKLRIAEWVLAIGNPFQLSGTVTLGIVSTVSRSQSGAITDFIQTDAAINPGNSGGALVNARAELVGINSMIYSETGGNQGIGFAIPANLARRIMDALVATGSVPWGSIGFVETLDAAAARRFGFESFDGLLVSRLARASAAYNGGLRPGDVLVSLNGQKTTDRDVFERLVANQKVGTRVKAEILREGRRMTLDITVESRQQQPVRRRQ